MGTRLLGKETKPELVELFSNEKQVTVQTPPVFLAHALDELSSGGHGLKDDKGPMWDAGQTQSLEWLAARKLIPAGCRCLGGGRASG